MNEEFRQGTIVHPYERLKPDQVESLHRASLAILNEPGIWCYNPRVAELFGAAGARVNEIKEHEQPVWRISLPAKLVEESMAKAPSSFVLGARRPENRLLIDAETPRVYFGSGSETNVWLETRMETFNSAEDPSRTLRVPQYSERRGSAELLCRAANLCENLENLDFFIRPVNIQDPGV
ncbi:MAG: trimethylamine methyltransferase family protein, partial [Desulfobacteraceae bacterium]